MSQPRNLYLYATILNKYLYFFSIDAEFVRPELTFFYRSPRRT